MSRSSISWQRISGWFSKALGVMDLSKIFCIVPIHIHAKSPFNLLKSLSGVCSCRQWYFCTVDKIVESSSTWSGAHLHFTFYALNEIYPQYPPLGAVRARIGTDTQLGSNPRGWVFVCSLIPNLKRMGFQVGYGICQDSNYWVKLKY